jgi:vacuolar-type H+-ATPase catalytic subunit A/Vma1
MDLPHFDLSVSDESLRAYCEQLNRIRDNEGADATQRKKGLVEKVRREVRQGYTNQSVFRLLDIVSQITLAGALRRDSSFSMMAHVVAQYTLRLRDFQKQLIGIRRIKDEAIELLEVAAKWQENKL